MNLHILLPGDSFTGPFLDSLVQFMGWANTVEDLEVEIHRSGGSHVAFVREVLLGAEEGQELDDPNRVPFAGRDYDYILWIDSDIKFSVRDFKCLVEDMMAGTEVVAGWYQITGDVGKSCVMPINRPSKVNLTVDEIAEYDARRELIEVAHVGMGFFLMKSGVLEKIVPPYFLDSHQFQVDRTRYVGEDVAFCGKIRETGTHIYVDPRVKVGHYKSVLL